MINITAERIFFNKALTMLFWAFIGATVLFVGGQVYLPLSPVPLTAQTFVVLMIGFLSAPRQVLATFGMYFGLALLGVPFVPTTNSFAAFFGPTAGYLIGFFVSAYAMAFVRQKWEIQKLTSFMLVGCLGALIYFLLGWAWLSAWIGSTAAFSAGVMPFLLWDSLKVLLASHIAYWGIRK